MNSNIDLSELKHILDFEYFETYSLQRGSDFEKIIIEKEEVCDLLSEKYKSEDLSVEENQKLIDLNLQLHNVQFLFDENQKLHYSAEKLKRFYSNDYEATELTKILKTKTENVPAWMCAPVYRDAIVFYDRNDTIIEVLNICFSCEFIQNSNKHFIDADISVYQSLKNLLIRFGHKIESD